MSRANGALTGPTTNPTLHPPQPPRPDAMRDGVPGQPRSEELAARDHPALTGGHRRPVTDRHFFSTAPISTPKLSLCRSQRRFFSTGRPFGSMLRKCRLGHTRTSRTTRPAPPHCCLSLHNRHEAGTSASSAPLEPETDERLTRPELGAALGGARHVGGRPRPLVVDGCDERDGPVAPGQRAPPPRVALERPAAHVTGARDLAGRGAQRPLDVGAAITLGRPPASARPRTSRLIASQPAATIATAGRASCGHRRPGASANPASETTIASTGFSHTSTIEMSSTEAWTPVRVAAVSPGEPSSQRARGRKHQPVRPGPGRPPGGRRWGCRPPRRPAGRDRRS